MRNGFIVTVLVVACVGLALVGEAAAQEGLQEGQEAVWIEGEDVAETNFNRHSWYHDVNTALLSGEDWVSHYTQSTGAAAEWKFKVEKGGKYTWWVRLNPFKISHKYAFDGGETKQLEFTPQGNSANLTAVGIDIRFADWVNCGEVELAAGEHTVLLLVETGEGAAHGGIDCMAFVNFDWTPSATEKPGGKKELSEEERKTALEKLLKMPLAKATQEAKGGKEYVWIEGEDASKSAFIKHGWYDAVQKMVLSNRDWLSHWQKGLPGAVYYKFEVKEGGKYTWWVRCNTCRLAQSYQLDAGKEVEMDVTTDVRENMMISPAINVRFMGWIKGGELELAKGPHVIKIVIKIGGEKPGEYAHGGIDCMALVNFPWAPSGTTKPKVEVEGEETTEEAAE